MVIRELRVTMALSAIDRTSFLQLAVVLDYLEAHLISLG
jgi:hypothetical protein